MRGTKEVEQYERPGFAVRICTEDCFGPVPVASASFRQDRPRVGADLSLCQQEIIAGLRSDASLGRSYRVVRPLAPVNHWAPFLTLDLDLPGS